MPYFFVMATILLTVYGQLVIKWRVTNVGPMPADTTARLLFLARFVFSPWVISSYTAAFVASLCWMGAMRQLALSYAYPFTSLSFVLVLILSALLFRESVTVAKALGMVFIIVGIIVASRQ